MSKCFWYILRELWFHSGEKETAGKDELLATENYFHVNIPIVRERWDKRIMGHRELMKVLVHNIEKLAMFSYVEEWIRGFFRNIFQCLSVNTAKLVHQEELHLLLSILIQIYYPIVFTNSFENQNWEEKLFYGLSIWNPINKYVLEKENLI